MTIAAIFCAARRDPPPAGHSAGYWRSASLARLALVAGLVLSGPPTRAGEPGAAGAPAGTAASCCADPAQFDYEPLPAAGAVSVVIDAHGPSFEFQSGRSYFHAFRLPAATRGYTLEIQSFLDPPHDTARSRVFYPLLALLTEDFLVARVTDLETLSFDVPTLERTSAPAYRLSVAVDPGSAHERYAVLFTPAGLLTTRALPPITTPESVAQVAHVAWLGAAPTGRLRVTVRPREDAPAGAAEAAQPAPDVDGGR